MKKNNFEILIASSTQREKVFCEIYYKGQILAEISQETEKPLIEIYSNPSEKGWLVSLEEFQEILEIAKTHLLGKNS